MVARATTKGAHSAEATPGSGGNAGVASRGVRGKGGVTMTGACSSTVSLFGAESCLAILEIIGLSSKAETLWWTSASSRTAG